MKILLPTDGSRHALAAARVLAEWFPRPGMHVDVIGVIPEAKATTRGRHAREASTAARWRGAAGTRLDATAKPLQAQGMVTRTISRQGNPAEVVVSQAGRRYDLVVVGAKGRGAAPFFDVGSVALATMEHAPTSVLMVRDRKPRNNGKRRPSKQRPLRVLLATDGTPVSDAALWRLIDLVGTQPVEVSVLSVADAPVGGTQTAHDARAASQKAADILSSHGMTASSKVRSGAAAPLIVAEADEMEADLLVLGSRAVHRPDERHLGSVALETARSSPCSVLIVRQEAVPSTAETPSAEEPMVQAHFDIAYRNLKRSPAIEEHVLRGIARLERLTKRLLRCRVTVELRQPRHKTGNLYHVRVELMLPDHEIVVSRTPPAHKKDEKLVNAIGEAFDTARRQLVEDERRQRGEVKAHEVPAHGRVTEMMPDHGFIEAVDGRTIYFHRNALPDDEFDALDLGSEVRFVERMGELGPQASTVALVGKHHLVG